MNIVSGWFTHTVKINPQTWEVIKTPRTLNFKDPKAERASSWLHASFLWTELIPETDVFLKSRWDFEVHQEYVSWFNPVDLEKEFMRDDVQRVLESWAAYQKETWNLFDIFGLQWMIALFQYYFPEGSLMRTGANLPINSLYLDKIHNFPQSDLEALKAQEVTSPFTAHNLWRNENGTLKFIDLDHRPINILNPLNKVWAWITEKALTDLKTRNQWKLILPDPKIIRI